MMTRSGHLSRTDWRAAVRSSTATSSTGVPSTAIVPTRTPRDDPVSV